MNSRGRARPSLQDTIPGILHARAADQPDAAAFTFIDYDVDPAGFSETLTWAELYDRGRVVAAELGRHGAPGDRAAILSPQSLDYIVAFLGALEAGFIVVPLSVPMFGAHHDERISSALADCTPAVVFATTTVIDEILPYTQNVPGVTPAVVEIDALDYHTPVADAGSQVGRDRTAVLQYTSVSTSSPRGVMVSHKNVVINGRNLGKLWRETAFAAYEGLTMPYFPNFLNSAGPYSWVGLSWFTTVECQMRHIARLFGEVRRRDTVFFEVREEANEKFLDDMTARIADSVFALGNCARSRSYWFNAKGETPLFRPTSVAEAVRAQGTFPLEDYLFS